jgi:hypothetical protein
MFSEKLFVILLKQGTFQRIYTTWNQIMVVKESYEAY